MSFCLYNTKEIFNFLKSEIDYSILEKWAETHNLYYDDSYIWKSDDLENFLNERFDLNKIIQIKTSNNIPLTEYEKLTIILNNFDNMEVFLKFIPPDEVIEIKKRNNIPISNQDCKDTIDKLKEDVYKNLQYENNLNSKKSIINSVKNNVVVSEYKETLKEDINEFEKYNTENWAGLTTQKHKPNKVLIFILIISALFGIFECVIH